MSSKYPHLIAPLKVGSLNYKNRMVAAPIYCGTFAGMDPLNKVLLKSITEKSEGGCASVTIGETPVDFEYASREPFPPIDYSDFQSDTMAWFKRAVEIIHKHGAVALIELSHCGESKLAIAGAGCAIGPMGYTRPDGVEVIAMDETLMDMVIERFIRAAKFMKAAGFDGVMVHAGHGWLLNQFLSPLTNKRTDEYGGSLENRTRFPLKLMKKMREALGENFLLEVRVSGSERSQGGMEIDEVAEFARMIEPYCDLIHVSVGLYRDPVLGGQFSSMYQPHGLNADMAKAIKDKVKIPVTVVGGINTPDLAEQLLAQGKCDLVAMARQLTADPDFAKKVLEGREEDITPCLRCYKCFPGPLEEVIDDLINLYGCTVNPKAFIYDREWVSSKAENSRKVLVVGGGIAGMQAALTAAERGHQVTLVEKSDKLGGLLNFTNQDSWKGDLRMYKDLMIRRVQGNPNITVHLNTELNPDEAAVFGADKVIIALGSSALVPKIPGIELAMQALDAYEHPEKVGENIVFVGAGLVGCEAGLSFARKGHKVTILEMADAFAPDAYPMHRWAMGAQLARDVTLKTGYKVTRIQKEGVIAKDPENKEHFFPADTVIHALGMKARQDEAKAMAKATGGTAVGDCLRPSKVYDAVMEGFMAAMAIS